MVLNTAHWVVGVDGSDSATHALDWAMAHAPGRTRALHLVTAWQAPIYGPYPVVAAMTSPYDIDALHAAAERDATCMAQEAAAKVDMPVEPIVVHGGASSTLLDAADHGSLLVVGSRGRGGFSRLLLGSTSHQCATHAAVPTVVVPKDAPIDPAKRILVGVDGSPNSLAALKWALEFAGPGTTLNVVWVWDASPLAVGADQFFFPEASDLVRERFEHIVESISSDANDAEITVTDEFIEGSPRIALADCAEHADLVVLGTRGHGAIGAALLGSVSSWLLHHVHCATVVVPGTPSPGEEPTDELAKKLAGKADAGDAR